MKNKSFQIISDIYSVLALYDATELREASNSKNISGNVRQALRLLSRELPLAARTVRSEKRRTSKGDQLSILDTLLDKRYFPTKSHLAQLAGKLGLRLSIASRDSRDRVARRIANIATKNNRLEGKLRKMLAERDNQTEGWLDIILGEE